MKRNLSGTLILCNYNVHCLTKFIICGKLLICNCHHFKQKMNPRINEQLKWKVHTIIIFCKVLAFWRNLIKFKDIFRSKEMFKNLIIVTFEMIIVLWMIILLNLNLSRNVGLCFCLEEWEEKKVLLDQRDLNRWIFHICQEC